MPSMVISKLFMPNIFHYSFQHKHSQSIHTEISLHVSQHRTFIFDELWYGFSQQIVNVN